MYSGSLKSTAMVTIQFILIVTIAWYCTVWGGAVQNIMTILAIALGVWAIIVMRLRVNIFPDVQQNQQLFTGGPYRYIRHPMYTAVLLATLAWTLNRFDAISAALWLLLLADLLVKLHYEQRLLTKQFESYADYQKRTKRLIPFVY